jgi:hypothetical protein
MKKTKTIYELAEGYLDQVTQITKLIIEKQRNASNEQESAIYSELIKEVHQIVLNPKNTQL